MAIYENLNSTVASGDITISGSGEELILKGGTATATAGAATLSQQCGIITTESLTTAAAAAYTLTLTNTLVAATSLVFATVWNGTNSAGTPIILSAQGGAGAATIKVQNVHATAALNGTLKIAFLVMNPD